MTLFEIIQGKNTEEILSALEGANLGLRDELGNSPLQLALAMDCEVEVIQALLDHGFSPLDGNLDGESCWSFAAKCSSRPEVITEVWNRGVSTSARNRCVLFRDAIRRGDPEIVRALLQAGAPAGERDEQGRTLLIGSAPRKNQAQIVKLLVQAGLDVKARDEDDSTVLQHAAFWGWTPSGIRALVRAGASVHARNRDGVTPLGAPWLLSVKQAKLCMRALVKAGANIDETNAKGETIIMQKLPFFDVEGIEFLLSLGASLEARNKEGNTVLAHAISWSFFHLVPMVKFLLSRGADLHARNLQGESILDLARQRKNPELVKFLVSTGAFDDATPP